MLSLHQDWQVCWSLDSLVHSPSSGQGANISGLDVISLQQGSWVPVDLQASHTQDIQVGSLSVAVVCKCPYAAKCNATCSDAMPDKLQSSRLASLSYGYSALSVTSQQRGADGGISLSEGLVK